LTSEYEKIDLKIESTWIEKSGEGFDRVIVFEYFCSEMLSSSANDLFSTMGFVLRERIAEKLSTELGLTHRIDYIFSDYEGYPKFENNRWIHPPSSTDNRTKIRIKDEEHYTMLKLHYHGD